MTCPTERQAAMFSLEGKVAFVTGCGSQSAGWGNSKAIAVTFARRGAAIYGVDLNREAAEDTRRIVEGEGGTFVVGAGDVTDKATVEALVADCVARLGGGSTSWSTTWAIHCPATRPP